MLWRAVFYPSLAQVISTFSCIKKTIEGHEALVLNPGINLSCQTQA